MIRRVYRSWRAFFRTMLSTAAPTLATKIRVKKELGYTPDLKNPKTLNEKMQWLKLNTYYNNPTVTKCADKYAVREFVCEKLGNEDTLVKLYGVWKNPDEIDWDALPGEFVLKSNHSSGNNIICRDKKKLDKADAVAKMKRWLKKDGSLAMAEYSYRDIPRKIIAEEFIRTEDNLPPKDYKFFCEYGEPKLIFVASERYNDNTKFDYFTPEWEWIPVQNCHLNAAAPPAKPEKYEEMLEVARKLAKEFPLVRVDLYYESSKIIFGELTFLHFGGVHGFTPVEYDRIFGDLFKIS